MRQRAIRTLPTTITLGILTLIAFQAGKISERLSATEYRIPAHLTLSGEDARLARWRTDLRVLAQELSRHHANAFHTTSRLEFQRTVQEINANIPQLTDDQIIVEFMRLAAKVGDGHTGVNSWLERFHRYPIRLTWFGNELRVTETLPEAKAALGLRLIRIDDTPIDEAYARVSQLASHETEAGTRNDSEYLLPRAEILHALKLLSSSDHGRFTFQDDGGKLLSLTLKPITAQASYEAPWTSVTRTPALFETRDEEAFWFTPLQQGRTIYVKYNRCEDLEGFKVFARAVLQAVDHPGVQRVIVDVRNNGGGHSEVLQPLLNGLKERRFGERQGSLVVLTNRWTYSSGMWAASNLKDLGGVIVGEASSQLVNFYGARTEVVLPHSKLEVSYAAGFFPLREEQGLLEADVPVVRTFDETVKGEDPALQAALGVPTVTMP